MRTMEEASINLLQMLQGMVVEVAMLMVAIEAKAIIEMVHHTATTTTRSILPSREDRVPS